PHEHGSEPPTRAEIARPRLPRIVILASPPSRPETFAANRPTTSLSRHADVVTEKYLDGFDESLWTNRTRKANKCYSWHGRRFHPSSSENSTSWRATKKRGDN